MEAALPLRILSDIVLAASADAGHGGQLQRDFGLICASAAAIFYTSTAAILPSPRSSTNSPPTQISTDSDVSSIFSSSGRLAPYQQESARLEGLEEEALDEVRRLLELLFPRLLMLTIVRMFTDLINASLRREIMLEGIRLAVLRELSVYGLGTTATAFEPLQADLLPSLRRLHIPSDILCNSHSAPLRLALPHLAHIVVSSLRRGYTILQLIALHRCGRHIGVFVRDRRLVPARRAPTPPPAGSVGIAMCGPLDVAHVADTETLH
ncbi:hypothetical protein PsYK624_131500 [Phanerochaete sordida]|uniref:Uncharacterized protein n=1 Tax=Phanerochaete sordida TaxID=48140 RepID=A0A9P3LIV9_9APHY|nr:hypothetical protein PsYK624_131500 [Phanerochaete sordida]